MRWFGLFYDGEFSRPIDVELTVQGPYLVLITPSKETLRLLASELKVKEAVPGAPQIVEIRGGGHLEMDPIHCDWLCNKLQLHVSKWPAFQSKWRYVMLLLVSTVLLAFGLTQWGIPAMADLVANEIPAKIAQKLGQKAMSYMDKGIFEPSTLSAEQKSQIRQDLQALRMPNQDDMPIKLVFRSLSGEPNAFALPDGTIVLTDQIVRLLQDKQETMGVLAHEMGHIEKRHYLRNVLRASAVGTLTYLLYGDSSGLLTGVATVGVISHYSRNFEREADAFAIRRFEAKHLPLGKLIDLQEKLQKLDQEDEGSLQAYLSTHPSGKERIQMIKQAIEKEKHQDQAK